MIVFIGDGLRFLVMFNTKHLSGLNAINRCFSQRFKASRFCWKVIASCAFCMQRYKTQPSAKNGQMSWHRMKDIDKAQKGGWTQDCSLWNTGKARGTSWEASIRDHSLLHVAKESLHLVLTITSNAIIIQLGH